MISIENIFGSNFDDSFIGDNNSNFFTGGAGNDTLNGGNGNDSASYSTSPVGVTINLTLGTVPDGFGTTDTLISIENITGSNFDDILIGNNSSNSFTGGAGNDTLNGGNGNENDSASYSNSPTGATVDLTLGTAADGFGTTDTLISIENVFGSNFDDIFIGNNKSNSFTGGAGNDTLNGGNGSDTASYSNSTAGVTVDLTLGTAADGFGTTDTLISIENVVGSNFADRITGDANNNRLTGGTGQDTFVFFAPGFGSDTIVDFTAGSGAAHDIIELHTSAFADFASLQNAGAITGTANTAITLGADTIILNGVNPALLNQDDFLFVPNNPASISGNTSGTLTEDDINPVTGALTVTDPDEGQSHTRVDSGTSVNGLGTYSVDAGGHWSYTVNNALVQYLIDNESTTDSFVLTSFDGWRNKPSPLPSQAAPTLDYVRR